MIFSEFSKSDLHQIIAFSFIFCKEIPDLTGQGNGFAAFIDTLRGP
jgi:hypothetical protein